MAHRVVVVEWKRRAVELSLLALAQYANTRAATAATTTAAAAATTTAAAADRSYKILGGAGRVACMDFSSSRGFGFRSLRHDS